MREKVEQSVLGLTAIFSVIVAVLEWFKLLPLPTGTLPSLTLLGIGLVTGYLVLERRSKLDNIENLIVNGTERIISSLGGVYIRRFSDSQEVYEYVVKRMREAKKSVDDMTWGPAERERTPASQKAFEKYVETISTICAKRAIGYREVMSFPPLIHLERAENMLRKNLFGYRLRYYEFTQEELPPLLSFMVIDSEEVIIAFYRAPFLPAEREIKVAVKHPDIVKLFQDYYDTIWQGAKVLKEDKADLPAFEELQKRVSKQLL